MLPPAGSVLIGPGPLCSEMVVLFAGRVMALDKEVMLGSDLDAKREHLMGVLTEYVSERIDEVLSDANAVSPLVDPDEDALREMILAYRQQGKEIPAGGALIEQLPAEV